MTNKVESPTTKYGKYVLHVPGTMSPFPEYNEITAAILLLSFFKTDIKFIERKSSKTADLLIGNQEWEIKSPTGNGKHNIQHQLQNAAKQAKYIVFDARNSKIDIRKITRVLKKQLGLSRSIKRIVLIRKDEKIVDIT